MVLLEYKGGFLSRTARYSGQLSAFTADVDKKFVDDEGCRQLAAKIVQLFAVSDSAHDGIMGLPTDKCTVAPVLVLQDHILRVPFLNCYLNKRFEEKLDRHIFRPDIVVRPLSVVNIHELETMVESAEASGFDFVYALHHRAVRDEEMLSNLQEFLMQFPQYGKERSARAIRVYDELQETMVPLAIPG